MLMELSCPFLFYCLCRIVPHSKINPNDYCTVSLNGVTRMVEGDKAEFVELEQWIADYKHFKKLTKIKTFSKFHLWKAFTVWRKNVRSRYIINMLYYSYCE